MEEKPKSKEEQVANFRVKSDKPRYITKTYTFKDGPNCTVRYPEPTQSKVDVE